MGTCRASGVEDDAVVKLTRTNIAKLDNNVQRARSKLLEYALCNDWQYFVTLTCDKAMVDRYNLKACYAALQKLIVSLNRKHNTKIKWLLIPEQHLDGAWHFHGFLSDVPCMCSFKMSDKLPKYVRDKLNSGDAVFTWQPYADKIGYTICEPIKNAEAAARYVTKYITKDLAKSVNQVGDHVYYCSQGLITANTVKKGRLADASLQNAVACTGYFVGEHCTTYWFDYSPELVEHLTVLLL